MTWDSNKPIRTMVLILVLSLATWLFFYSQSMPLTGSGTTVVVGIWFFVVLVVKAIWHRLHKKQKAG